MKAIPTTVTTLHVCRYTYKTPPPPPNTSLWLQNCMHMKSVFETFPKADVVVVRFCFRHQIAHNHCLWKIYCFVTKNNAFRIFEVGTNGMVLKVFCWCTIYNTLQVSFTVRVNMAWKQTKYMYMYLHECVKGAVCVINQNIDIWNWRC